MKCRMLMLVFAAIRLNAMDIQEEQVLPENKLQLTARNQNITHAQYAQLLTQFPKLQELNISGHCMEYIPEHAPATCLVKLDLSKGKLTNSNTLYLLLTQCPKLQECSIAHNQLTSLQETTLPAHNNLTKLDCSHNRITALDFTELRKKVPNLTEFNLAHCPLITCNTNDMKYSEIVPTINLSNTNLSDAQKIEIIKNSNNVTIGSFSGTTYVMSIASALGFGSIFVPLTIVKNAPLGALLLSGTGGAAAWTFAVVGTALGGSLIGYKIGMLLDIGCTPQKEREKEKFIPIFDKVPTYTEEEVTTHYQRFVRHFPDWRCWKTKGEEEALLRNVISE
jgi:hypothetical protein